MSLGHSEHPVLAHPPIFSFGPLSETAKLGASAGDRPEKALLGGKGANLAEMTRIGVPVPPGFTITTEVCTWHGQDRESALRALRPEIDAALARLESEMGQEFGRSTAPLLVSVRSGAPISMPGMMDTVLNVGLSPRTHDGLVARAGGGPTAQRFAIDCELRLIEMFGTVVREIPSTAFTTPRDDALEQEGVGHVGDLSLPALESLLETWREVFQHQSGSPFPEDPRVQLEEAIEAVFRSWHGARAKTYRRLRSIPDDLGTAVNVQAMVFGNSGANSATGVCFTRDPATGEPELYGEFLANAQGEEVVAGTRTPLPIARDAATPAGTSFEELFPACYRELLEVRGTLEGHYGDVQDIEFTVEEGRLHILQTRRGQRTGLAALRIATDLVEEERIDPAQAIDQVEADALGQLLAPVLTPQGRATASERRMTIGLAAGPGGASGRIALDAETAVAMAADGGGAVILVRDETSPEDIAGMAAAAGILTARGGATSHAAVVARGLGKPCVVGCADLRVSHRGRRIEAGGVTLSEGDTLSIDGSTGEVFAGAIETMDSEVLRVIEGTLPPANSSTYQRFDRLLSWADERRTIGVRANADTPADARRARALGAEGIGLCRTEHMFFGEERILAFRQMILAHSVEGRCISLDELLPWQREDFRAIFEAMDGLPVTIRLLDPPLHEFLPQGESEIARFAEEAGLPIAKVITRIEETRESNPMLGTRGCRLGLLHPEIIEMQARAVFEAARIWRDAGGDPRPEVMIPLVGIAEEAIRTRARIDQVASEVFRGSEPVPYLVGTMIEIPRAALTADRIAEGLDFFSFGTNDLTQMTYGFSRDDTGGLLAEYMDEGILRDDPFITLDRDGVGRLIAMATEKGRAANPNLKVGICGEHGGDPRSIAFCREVGLDYVSSSPLRVPGARLAAAQTLKE